MQQGPASSQQTVAALLRDATGKESLTKTAVRALSVAELRAIAKRTPVDDGLRKNDLVAALLALADSGALAAPAADVASHPISPNGKTDEEEEEMGAMPAAACLLYTSPSPRD